MNTQKIKELYSKKGYRSYSGPFNMNIFGIRTRPLVTDAFDDTLGVFYQDLLGNEQLFTCQATLDAGSFWMQYPMNPSGTAFVAPGQYSGLWYMGFFKGQRALIQKNPVAYYRDNNKDLIIDLEPGTIKNGVVGFFLHPHFQRKDVADIVYNSSAMCVVPKDNKDFNKLMAILQMQINARRGNSFTFTVFDEDDETLFDKIKVPNYEDDDDWT